MSALAVLWWSGLELSYSFGSASEILCKNFGLAASSAAQALAVQVCQTIARSVALDYSCAGVQDASSRAPCAVSASSLTHPCPKAVSFRRI